MNLNDGGVGSAAAEVLERGVKRAEGTDEYCELDEADETDEVDEADEVDELDKVKAVGELEDADELGKVDEAVKFLGVATSKDDLQVDVREDGTPVVSPLPVTKSNIWSVLVVSSATKLFAVCSMYCQTRVFAT